LLKVFGHELKLGEQVELHRLGERGHFGGADFVEDDLKHLGVRI